MNECEKLILQALKVMIGVTVFELALKYGDVEKEEADQVIQRLMDILKNIDAVIEDETEERSRR